MALLPMMMIVLGILHIPRIAGASATIGFKALYVFVIIEHGSPRIAA